MSVVDSSHVAPHPDVVFREVEGEVVLLNTSTGQYFSLDAVGSRIWALMGTQGATRASIEATLLAEFEVDADRLHADLDVLFGQLTTHALISVS